MADPAVFLIHGLGGTQYDLGSMHKRLKNAGFVTHSITLPGHGGQPPDLIGVRAEDWLEAVRTKYRELAAEYEVLHVMGMCMGSLLAIETCKRERHAKGRLVALAPPVYIDGWSTPWYRELRHALYFVPAWPTACGSTRKTRSASRTNSCAPSCAPSSSVATPSPTAGCRWPASASSTACAAS